MTKKRIAFLYGGKADEHSISCISAAGVLSAVDENRFEIVLIAITKQGEWIVGGEDPRNFHMQEGKLPVITKTEHTRDVVLDPALGADGFLLRENDGTLTALGHIDAVFPILHGPNGEDGTLQGLLEMMRVPYVGCGVLASATCMDKYYAKQLFKASGIAAAPGIAFDVRKFASDESNHFASYANEIIAQVEDAKLEYPLFVKPSRAGSSFGVTKVESHDAATLAEAVYEASKHDWRVLVEQGINAREIECAVLAARDGEEPKVSLPGEIVLDKRESGEDQFYDFDSKYMDAKASHVEVPAKLPEETLQLVRKTALAAFKAVDGRGLSRVDSFVTPQGHVMINEINTMPGFTPISMYPKAWEATGISYSDLITKLIEGVLE